MMKLKSVLLIDDDYICSCLDKKVLDDLQIVEYVECLPDAETALDYLAKVTSQERVKKAVPDVIFLDINMPNLDGFDFLDKLSKMNGCEELVKRTVMLSSSIHQLDKARAHSFLIHSFITKSLISLEEESAIRLAKKMQMKGVLDSFELSDRFSIIEAKVPDEFVGKTVEEVDFAGQYGVNLLTILKMREAKNLFGQAKLKPEVASVVHPSTVLERSDILVLFGKPENIKECLRE